MSWQQEGSVYRLVDQYAWTRAFVWGENGLYLAVVQVGPEQWRPELDTNKRRLMREVVKLCPYVGRKGKVA